MGAPEAPESGPEAEEEVETRRGVSHAFLSESRRFLTEEYPAKIDAALAHLEPEDLWWRPHPDQNSIANLLLHLAGNVRQWVVHGIGEEPDTRTRANEFSARAGVGTDEEFSGIRRDLKGTLADADQVLEGIRPSALHEQREIQGIRTTVFGALYHVVEHFSMHTGQILFIAKLRSGVDLRFYDVDAEGRVTGRQW